MPEHRPLLPGSPIARALGVVGDRWTVLILREMFLGHTRFGEIAEATGASRATLTKRLRALVANGLCWQNPYQQRPLRVEYRLTDKGAALYDFALAVWLWEYHYGARDEQRLPPRLRHRGCAKRFLPVPACTRCGEEIRIQRLGFRAGRTPGESSLNQGALRRSAAAAVERAGNGLMLHFVDVVADHWTPLVLAATFMGLRRFDDIHRELGIATNILAHRLRLLVEAGVLRQQQGESTRRLEYRLTDKGRALVVPALALHQWSLQWLPTGRGAGMQIRHLCSPRPLAMQMRCSGCHGALLGREVAF
jgi:DNA-binding HxlR family transcriptional regulator